MALSPLRSLALTTTLALSFTAIVPPRAAAEEHLVPLAELHREVDSAAAARQRNLEDLNRVLSLPQAEEAFQRASVSRQQVTAAVAVLNDQELARLADRARVAEKDVQGGIIVGLLALIGLVVVIIIVVAVVAN